MVSASNGDFLEEVIAETPNGERIRTCLQCGTCGGSCPNGTDMSHSPRAVIHMLLAGMKAEVMQANTMWQCVSCYYCTERCPKEIPITDLMYTLKNIAVREGRAKDSDAAALASTFADFVHKYGRSYEFGLASRYYLKRKPGNLLRMGPLGLSMLRHGRMQLKPSKIQAIDQLRAIIDRADAIGGAS